MRGSIIRQKSGSWRITVSLGKNPKTGKYEKYQETFRGSKRDADRRLAELIALAEKGYTINPEKITFGEFLDKWLQDYGRTNLARRTMEGYESIIKHHLKPHLGHIQIAKLQPSHLRDFYSELLRDGRRDNKKTVAKGLSPTTVLNIHRLIHEVLNHALQLELVFRNAADAVKPPRPEARETPYMSQDEISKLLSALRGTYLYIPTYIAICTGMRLGEVLALRWQDVDLKNGIITVRQSLGIKRKDELESVPEEELPAKGRNETYFKTPKTKQSRRSVDIPAALVDELKKHQLQQKKDRIAFDGMYNDHGLVCCLQNGDPIHLTTASSMFSRLAKRAGVNITFHGLRHSHATWLFQQNEHPKAVSERLGHSKTGITLDLYTHAVPGTQKKLAEKIDTILASKKQPKT